MARKIIILNEDLDSSDLLIHYVLWLDVPPQRQAMMANSSATTVVKDATVLEIDALKAGRVVEAVGSVGFKKGSGLQAMKTRLESIFSATQQELNARNAFRYYGASWDGSVWTAGGAQ